MGKRLVSVSKYLAKHLRHALHDLGLTLQPGGWVRLTICSPPHRRTAYPTPATYWSSVPRQTTRSGSPSTTPDDLIRANQGYSVEVDILFEGRVSSEML